MQTSLADARSGDEDHRRVRLCDQPIFISMLVLVAAADWRLVVPLVVWLVDLCRRSSRYFVPQLREALERAGGRALDDDRPDRRQLHQHRHGQAVLACRPRGESMRARAWTSSCAPCTGRCGMVTRFNVAGLPQQLRWCCFRSRALSIWFWLNGAGLGRRDRRRDRPVRCASTACRSGSCGKCRRCSKTSARSMTAWA